MLEEKDFKTIGSLLDQKLKENNKILKDEIVAEIGAATSEAFSAVEVRIDKLDIKVDKLGEEMAKRPTMNQITSWGDKKIVSLELDMDKVKYIHQDELDKLPPQEEISRVLVERGYKCKRSKIMINYVRFKNKRERERVKGFLKNSGFTLIELLVVISIIGFLATASMVAFNSVRMKARDTRRLADIAQIKKALDLYYDSNNNYPEEAHSGCYDGWETSCDPAGNFIDALRTSGFMAKVPFDPVNNSTYFYAYYNYDAAYAQSLGCPFNSAFSVLAIRKFEANNSNIGISAQCPGRNWYPEFDYSILFFR